MDNTTIIAATTIICGIVFALIGVIYYSLKELIKQNLELIKVMQDDIKELRRDYATKKEVKEVKVDLSKTLEWVREKIDETNKLSHEILLKLSERNEK